MIFKEIGSVAVVMIVSVAFAWPARAEFMTVDNFSDIILWAGSGDNEAGFVLQFSDGDDPTAIAWGYRWTGDATMQDMMFAIAGNSTVNRESPLLPLQYSGLDSRLRIQGAEDDFGFGPVVFLNSVAYDQVGLPVAEWSQVDRPLVGNYDEDGTFLGIYVWSGASGIWNQALANSSFQASDFGISELALASGNWYALGLATIVDPWPAPPLAPVFTQPVSAVAVPEPGTWALGAGAIVAALGLCRRRNLRAQA